MNTKDRISELIKEQYNNWNGSIFASMKSRHENMRIEFGDDGYLTFLERSKLENPHPVYVVPDLGDKK